MAPMHSSLSASLAVWCFLASSSTSVALEQFRLLDPDTFTVEQAADTPLAHDIYSMCLDAQARVLVSGPGYIRRLVDANDDGVFDDFVNFFEGPAGGCQGMTWHGSSLYTTGGRGLERYDDANRDGVADGPPERLLRLSTGGEHNSHALRVGPDRSLYFLGGNYNGLPHGDVTGFSPVPRYYAGIFCRMSLDARSVEVWSDGMRNAYDFDFSPTGAIFGWDSDSERDEGLLWYRPCRLYHFTPGADCGWRSIGSGKVPIYALDSVRPTAEVHRGSPTGVATYWHDAFPARYRGGVLALDWTLGRVYLFRPRPRGASYAAEPEIFLQAAGNVSFAPTDIVIAPDGSVLISSGGRGIAGSVWRVRATTGARGRSPSPPPLGATVLDVLRQPVPMAAWSRTRWHPLAKKLGADAFINVLRGSGPRVPASSDPEDAHTLSVRALEVLIELFPGRCRDALDLATRSRFTALRAQAARWIGVFGRPDDLIPLLDDTEPRVLRNAAESAARFWKTAAGRTLAPRVLALGGSRDRRLRQAAIASLSLLPDAATLTAKRAGERSVLGHVLARRTPRGKLPSRAIGLGLANLSDAAADNDDRLDALRVINAAFDRLEDGEDPRYVTFDSRWETVNLEPHARTVEKVLDAVGKLVLDEDDRIAHETWRLAGKLRSQSPVLARALSSGFTSNSSASDDFFRLWCLARLSGSWDDATLKAVADAGVSLAGKIRSQSVRRDNKWKLYEHGVWERLVGRHPELAGKVVRHRSFGDAEHLALIGAAPPKLHEEAARTLLDRELPGSVSARRDILDYASRHSKGEDRSRLLRKLRTVAREPGLRTLAIEVLSHAPIAADRDLFLDALRDDLPRPIPRAVHGLERLSRDSASDEELLHLLRWAYIFDRDPKRRRDRDTLAARIETITSIQTGYQKRSKKSQRAVLDAWSKALRDRAPERAKELLALREVQVGDDELVERLLATAPWGQGDAGRGRIVFESRSCGSCHHLGSVGRSVGPGLAGVGRRLDLHALLVEIATPSKVVAERYLITEYLMKNGEVIQGKSVYTARDADVTVTRDGSYRRIDPTRLLGKTTRPLSLMPDGLLGGLTSLEVADLVAYIRKF